MAGGWDQGAGELALPHEQEGVAQIDYALGVAVRLAPQARQTAAQLVVHAFDDVRVRLALGELPGGEDVGVAAPVVGEVPDARALRNLRAQRSGCSGVTIAQRPSENSVGSAINSPPQPS